MVEIIHLADRMDLFPLISRWLWEEWPENNSLADIEYRTRHCLKKDGIPQSFIALVEGIPAGTVSLWANDLKSRQDLTPFLACLYVDESYRNLNIGTMLQDFILEKAQKMGYDNLYLITFLEQYYEKNGWIFMEQAPVNGEKVRLYSHPI